MSIIVCYCDLECFFFFFFFQAEDGIRDLTVTGVQTCALPILAKTSFSFFNSSNIKSTSGLCCSQNPGRTSVLAACAAAWLAKGRCTSRNRSEERRVGKECRSRWSAQQ